MTRFRLPAFAADALRFVGVAAAAALIVAVQAAFVGPVKPAWVEATPYGLPLAVALVLGPRGLVPLLAGTLAADLAFGLVPAGVMTAAGVAEYLAACWLLRRFGVAPGEPSIVVVVRLTVVAGLTALARAAVAGGLCATDPVLAREVFFATLISGWLANVTLAPLALAWGLVAAWRDWTARRVVELAGLLAGASACVVLLYQPAVQGDVALTLPVTCLFFLVAVAVVVRFEVRGAVLFQYCATAVFTAYCYRHTRDYSLESPGILLTTGFFGLVNVMAMFLAASWAERRVAGESRELLFAEVLRQRDELQRLSAERGVQQAFLAATLDQLPAGVISFGSDERVLTMNAVAREWFAGLNVTAGMPLRGDVNWATYRPDGSLLATDDCPVVFTVGTGQSLKNVVLRYVSKDRPDAGRELTLNSAPVLGPGGENLGAIALYQDLTAFDRNERRLRESEARLRMVMRWTRLQLWDCDLATGELVTSDPIVEWFELDAPGPVETLPDYIGYVHPGDRDRLLALTRTAVAEGRDDIDISYRIPHGGGATRWYLSRGRVLRDAAGRPTSRYTGVTIDITKEKADEQRLRQLESVVVHARDGVVVLEAEPTAHAGRSVLYVNDAFARMTGYAGDELVGRSLHVLRGPDSDPATLDRLRRGLDSGEPLQVELLNYRKDGSTFWVELSLVPVPDGDADVRCAYWVMIQRDVTDRKRAERALREREDQLRQAQKMETVGQLAGGVAHDFNNLLTAVIGNLCLMDLPAGDPNQPLLAVAQKAAHRAAELISKLLGFARRNQMLVAPVDVGEFVEEVVDLLRRTIDPRITFLADIPPLEWRVLADAGLLNQVLLNLCVNARDAMPAGGELRIAAEPWRPTPDQVTRHLPPAAYYLRLSVTDTGTGMAPEVRARLFEPFFTTKPIGQGTGLGLAMVDGIVRQHEGWVECETEPGVGTTFHLFLPAVSADDTLDDFPAKAVKRSHADFSLDTPVGIDPPDPRPTRGGRILLVDDEEMIRMISRTVLEAAGYAVREATDGVEAVECFREHHADIDLVILDLVMPRLSGRDASKRMVALDPAVKILLSSGYSTDDVSDIPEALGLLSKPYRPNELLAAVRDALDPRPALA